MNNGITLESTGHASLIIYVMFNENTENFLQNMAISCCCVQHISPYNRQSVAGRLGYQNRMAWQVCAVYHLSTLMVSFCKIDANLEIYGKRESQLRNSLYQVDLWTDL